MIERRSIPTSRRAHSTLPIRLKGHRTCVHLFGPSSKDGKTNDNTPTFKGLAEAGAEITLFANDALIGSTPVQADGSWVFTSTAAFNDGTYTITASATDAAGNTSSFAQLGTALIIDTVYSASTPVQQETSFLGAAEAIELDINVVPATGEELFVVFINPEQPVLISQVGDAGVTLQLNNITPSLQTATQKELHPHTLFWSNQGAAPDFGLSRAFLTFELDSEYALYDAYGNLSPAPWLEPETSTFDPALQQEGLPIQSLLEVLDFNPWEPSIFDF